MRDDLSVVYPAAQASSLLIPFMVRLAWSVTCYRRVLVIFVRRVFKAPMVTYVPVIGNLGLTDRGVAHELSNASWTSKLSTVGPRGAPEGSGMDFLSFCMQAQVVSLTTIVYCLSP